MKRIAIALGVCVLLVSANLAQYSPAQSQPFSTPTFRAGSHLVLLDVVVTDKTGNPLPGLTKADFAVKEDGKTQTVAFVSAAAPSRLQSAPTLPAGVYSNAPEYRLPGGVPTAIILDSANTPLPDQSYARSQMLQFLREQHQAGQRMAIFGLTDRLFMLQDFTDDPAILAEALRKFDPSRPAFVANATDKGPSAAELNVSSPQVYAALAEAFASFEKSTVQYSVDRRAEVTLAALSSITRMFGGLHGRKNIIWLTGGFPFSLTPELQSSAGDLSDFNRYSISGGLTETSHGTATSSPNLQYAERIREIAAQMATSQIALYPVDVKGLVPSLRDNTVDRDETMREIAFQTG